MKRLVMLLCATFIFSLAAESAHAGFGSLSYGGWQPWWNIFKRNKRRLSPEERRLQQFWRDYYDALRRYYGMMDNIDWVAYYKNHGYQINAGCGGAGGPCGGAQRIQFAPVFVSPTMQWAVPNSALSGPAAGPPPCPTGFGQPMGYAAPMGYGHTVGYGGHTAQTGYGQQTGYNPQMPYYGGGY